jgi:hypothetical protein
LQGIRWAPRAGAEHIHPLQIGHQGGDLCQNIGIAKGKRGLKGINIWHKNILILKCDGKNWKRGRAKEILALAPVVL